MADPLSIIALGANAVGNLLGIGSQIKANKTNLEINKQQIAHDTWKQLNQHLHDVDMFNLSNEYNTPSAQKQRLLDAGINPAFALGQISPQAISASSTTSGGSPSQIPVQPVDYGALGRGVNDAVSLVSTLRQMNAQTRKIENEADYQEIANKFAFYQNWLNLRKTMYDGNVSDATAKKVNEEFNQFKEQRDWNFEIRRLTAGSIQSQIDDVNSKIAQRELENKLITANTRLSYKQIQKLSADITEIAHKLSLIDSQAEYQKTMSKNVHQLTLKYMHDNDPDFVSIVERSLENQADMYKAQSDRLNKQTDSPFTDLPIHIGF